MPEDYVDIKFSSYDVSILDLAVNMVMEKIDRTDVVIRGPIPIPKKRKLFTLNRSPHVNKNSREHFALFSYFRLLRIIGSNHRLVSSLHDIDLPAGVGVKIKVAGK